MDPLGAVVNQDKGAYLKSLPGWRFGEGKNSIANSCLYTFSTGIVKKAHRALGDAQMTFEIVEHSDIAPLLFKIGEGGIAELENNKKYEQKRRLSCVELKLYVSAVNKKEDRKLYQKTIMDTT